MSSGKRMATLRVTLRKADPPRVLDLDTECRPLHYSEWRREDQITAIAWSWIGSKKVDSRVLEQDLSNESPDAPLPDAIATGREPFMVVGAMAGG